MENIEALQQRIAELENQTQTLQAEVQAEREINRRKNTLISQISHEIRTPLNVVISMASIAKEELNNPQIVQDNLTEIATSSRILLGIVNNILDISDLAAGSLKVDSQKFDLKDQLTSLGIYFYEHAKYKDVHFDMHIRGVSEENLIGDEHRLQQIMVNLFTNALRFTPEGGRIDLTVVQASTSRNRVHMRFIFKDTGSGVPASTIRNIFLPYEEKTSVDSNIYTNTGISLFVTKQLVEVLGGSISLNSRLGEGTTITVDLPFQKTEQKSMNIEAIKRHRILIVADDVVAEDRGKMLQDMGLSFESVCDGDEAMDLLGTAEENNAPFSVCMIDMNMKNTDAEAFLTELKQIFPKNPLVIATSYDSGNARYQQLGADYTIENTLFRSTIFDALMKMEKGSLIQRGTVQNLAQHYDFSRKRILVVEDIALNMEVVVKLLGKVNASVVCAENGLEALQTFRRKPAGYFDCILMDVNMPVMDGYEATRAIRESEKENAVSVPIFAMTANAFSEDITRALESGMNGHIAKPIDVQILYRTLHRVFNGFDNPELESDLLEKTELLERQNTELKERAEHDPLTGLYNRYAYEKETYSLMRKKEPVGFLLLDIDFFKEINDTYGHETGDQVILHVAEILKANAGPTDFIVRLGGDEFGMILREFDAQPRQLRQLQEKIALINRRLQNPPEGIPGVTLSVGAAFSDMGYTTELYGNADKALYQTKKNGRCGCTIFRDEQWNPADDLERMRSGLQEYMKFTPTARPGMGDMISLTSYRLLEYSLKAQLALQYGEAQQKELFRRAGFNAGIFFSDAFLDGTLDLPGFTEQLAEKMAELKMGRLELEDMNSDTGEAILSVLEDADCSGMTSIGETVCHYDEGFIAGVLSSYTGKKYNATEVECWAKGDQLCRFVAAPQYHENRKEEEEE